MRSRRRFLGLGAGISALFSVPAGVCLGTSDIAKGHTLEGKPLPTIDPSRRTRGGTLCPKNAQHFAAKITEMLGQKFCIATTRIYNSDVMSTELQTDAELYCDWVDGSEEPIKASQSDDFVGIAFSAGHYFYVFQSRAKSPSERNNFNDADFRFSDGQIVVKERAPSGVLIVHVFRAQSPEQDS